MGEVKQVLCIQTRAARPPSGVCGADIPFKQQTHSHTSLKHRQRQAAVVQRWHAAAARSSRNGHFTKDKITESTQLPIQWQTTPPTTEPTETGNSLLFTNSQAASLRNFDWETKTRRLLNSFPVWMQTRSFCFSVGVTLVASIWFDGCLGIWNHHVLDSCIYIREPLN